MEGRNYWLRSGFFTLMERGSGLVFSLGTAVLLLRGLSKEDFAAWGLFLILSYTLEMGRAGLIQNGLMRFLSTQREHPAEYRAITTAALTLSLVYSLVSNLLLWAGFDWLIGMYHVPQIAAAMPVYVGINVLMILFCHFNFVQQANFEFRGLFWSNFCYRGMLFAWVLWCKLNGHPFQLQQLALAMLAGALVGTGASWLFAKPFLQHNRWPDRLWVGKLVAYGKYVLGTNLSTMFYKSIDRLTLGHIIGPAAFAVYDAAAKITQLVEAPSFSIAAVVFPQSAVRMEKEGAAGVQYLYERSVGAILAIILPFLVCVLFFAEPIIYLFAGKQYMESANVLRFTAFFGLFMPFAVQFGTVLDSTGKPEVNFRYTLFTAVLNLGLSYAFILQFGLFGAAYAILLGYAVSFVLMQRLLHRNFGIRWWRAFGYSGAFYKQVWQMLTRAKPQAETPVNTRLETLPDDYDVVFFSLFRTDNPYSSISLSMAKELAKTRRVLYVNHPYSLRDIWHGLRAGDPVLRKRLPNLWRGRTGYEMLPQIPHNFIAVQPPPTLPINWLPQGALYRFFQGINNGIVLRAIRKTLRDHQVHNYVYINCYDPFFVGVLPENMGAVCCIYHCIDDITQDAYTAKHGTALEQDAIRKADYTFVTSTNLQRLKAPFSDRIVLYFNAADVSVFQRVNTERFTRPKELEGRPGQVIGFIGNLDALRIDYVLLKKIALHFPDKTLLLVGPVNSPEPKNIGLDQLPNVVFAGPRKLDELPALLQYMDCALIPFLCNTLTRSIYPLKINEYLAAGKPVVSSAFSEDIGAFASEIYLADGHDAFLFQIGTALAEQDATLQQRRVAVAAWNTWEARIRQLLQLIHDRHERTENRIEPVPAQH